MTIWTSALAKISVALSLAGSAIMVAEASEFDRPWRDKERAIVLDGYEFNEIDFTKVVTDPRVAAFIHKASDGMPTPYRCSGSEHDRLLCRAKWRRYAVGRELFQTRRALAKALGLKWGAYHLGRPGNPIQQAQHFLDYAKPSDDDVMVIDIEDNDPEKWMSLEDAERFARYIHNRTGRWPMLYTNGSTARHVADNRADYPVLSRLPLWYARYRPSINGFFPKGHWQSYDIWQFVAQVNCSARNCPYRVPGTNRDMDVNVVDMTVAELKAAWPLDSLHPERPSAIPVIPEQAPDGDMLLVDLSTDGAAAQTPRTPADRPLHGPEALMAAYLEHEVLIDEGHGFTVLSNRKRWASGVQSAGAASWYAGALAAMRATRSATFRLPQLTVLDGPPPMGDTGQPLAITVTPGPPDLVLLDPITTAGIAPQIKAERHNHHTQ